MEISRHSSLKLAGKSILFTRSRYGNQRQYYNKLVEDAKLRYERTVETSMQRLNDTVETAGRQYDDVIYELGKKQ